tara:strand:- start:3734 stop:4894 length:1161 start_codon:yes stop_codon:yes gene_type:complete
MKIGFIGLGKLGKDAAEVLGEKHDVLGYDINPNIETEVPMAATMSDACKDQDLILVAVQTPHDPQYGGDAPTSHLPTKDFNYEYAIKAIQDCDSYCNPGTLIALISTVLPGTIREHISKHVKNGQFVYNPYLIGQGTVKWDMRNPEMIMIGTEYGLDPHKEQVLRDCYDPTLEKPNTRYVTGTWEEIEALKVFYNTFISTKLSLVNMIQDTAIKIGNINVDVVTKALAESTQRIMGPSYLRAGFGDGGGCHPRDNIALRYMAEKYDFGYDLFGSIMQVREQQAKNMADFCARFKNDVVILGKRFKPGLKENMTMGSPSMLVGWFLDKQNFNVFYDAAPTNGIPYTYLIHDNTIDYTFNRGSVVIDPYRELPSSNEYHVIHYGNTRL